MNIEYDPEVDAAYLRVKPGQVARTQVMAPYVNVDLDAEGEVLGIEFLYVTKTIGALAVRAVPIGTAERAKVTA